MNEESVYRWWIVAMCLTVLVVAAHYVYRSFRPRIEISRWCMKCGGTIKRAFCWVDDQSWCMRCVGELPASERTWEGTRINGDPVAFVSAGKVKKR